jgi:hypothetical protein
MPTREEDDFARQARALVHHGRAGEAERLWRRLLIRHHVVDIEYDDWARGAADCYRALRRHREAALIYLFLHYFDQAREYFPPERSRFELGVCLELERRYVDAAREYAEAGRPVMAAISLERGGDDRGARAMWERVLTDRRLAGETYERALVLTNLGLCLARLGDTEGAGRALVSAQQVLEAAADGFETAGQRDRAFYCYQVLIELGKRSGSFENSAEGYLNCIRVMKEDDLKYYVFQYCEDFVTLALERHEYHAAATVLRETADYALKCGLPYDQHYLMRSAEVWQQCAAENLKAGGPTELSENALVAAIEAFAVVGQFRRVGECYVQLGQLPLADKKKRRFAAAAERYRDAIDPKLDGGSLPESFRQPHAYADVWYLDLVEWELDGDWRAVVTLILGDLHYPDSFRRRALSFLLEPAAPEGDAAESVRVAQRLSELQLYVVLRPLERLYEAGDARARAAVIRGLEQMFYTRSFGLLGRALSDASQQVREAAIEALRKLHFAHAFDALVRIFQTHTDDRVRQVALESIGELGSIDAAEFLIGILRYESAPLAQKAGRLLERFGNPEIVPLVRSYAENETGPSRGALERVLRELRRAEAM